MQFYPLALLSVFSVSQINLQKQGYEDPATHEWMDSYWVIGLVTDTLEHYEGISYTFDNEEAQDANTIGEKTLVVTSEVKVTITPLQPYYERSMRYVTYTVYPKTYGMWMNKLTRQCGKLTDSIDELKVTVLQFTEESWKLYTPFKVQVYKNGVLKDEKTVNTVGGTETVILTGDSPEEDVKVQNLGKLGTGLGEPAFGDLVIFDPQHIFKIEGNILNEIEYDKDTYSYSNYWFGGGSYYLANLDPDTGTMKSGDIVKRWPDDGSPAHFFVDDLGINCPVHGANFPGNIRTDTFLDYYVKPVAADIYKDKPADQPVTGNPSGYSLVNYLANQRNHRIYVLDNFDEYNQGIEVNEDNKMRVYLPLSSFNNLVTVWISTEIADAIVYQPVLSKGVITDIHWLGSGEISDKDIVSVTVKQESQDGGRIIITASGMQGYPMQVSPTTDSVILNYGETHTFFFTAENLGTGTAQTGTLQFTLTNDQGEQTDRETLSFKLQPQIGDQTTLTVTLHDKEGYRPSGILVTVNYGVNSKSGVASNGYLTFDLDAYKGGVSLATQETDTYKAASATASVSAGKNSVYLELRKKGEPLTLWDMIRQWITANTTVIIITCIAVATAVVGIAVYKRMGS